MQEAIQNNKTNNCPFCGYQLSGQGAKKAKKPSLLTDKIVNPAFLEFMVTFFDFQDVKALGKVNHFFNNNICTNKKKFRLIGGDVSLLFACRVQNLLCHTREKPMTSHKLREFDKLQRLFNVTINFHSSVLHFKADFREDYQYLWILQKLLKHEILPNMMGKPRSSEPNSIDYTARIEMSLSRYDCVLPILKQYGVQIEGYFDDSEQALLLCKNEVDRQVMKLGLDQLENFPALQSVLLDGPNRISMGEDVVAACRKLRERIPALEIRVN